MLRESHQEGGRPTAMRLELTPDDARALSSALTLYLQQLRSELVKTDDREFRAGLASDLAHLEEIARRLDNAMDELDMTA